MPILRQHDIAKACGEAINDWHHFVATRHCQCAARTEIVLHVDDNERVVKTDVLLCKRAHGAHSSSFLDAPIDICGESVKLARNFYRIDLCR